MRLALLASAAICLSAGAALAQTSMTSPAPTGATNAPMASPAPQASPGNMAPTGGAADSGMTAGSMAPMSNGTASSSQGAINPAQSGGLTSSPKAAETSPHYNGQNSVSPPAGQASAMTNTSGSTGMDKTRMAYSPVAMSMPENGGVSDYLKIASKAIRQHNKAVADDALSHAETRMLDRAVPASAGAQPDDSPAITAIEHARQALSSGDYQTAASDTKMAMHERHGMMGERAMGQMDGSNAMGGPTQ